ncbi:acyl-coenzyme A thioesterase PaaI-like protein [Streptosporangium lutulentum]|uniref:Acyl-coenzyme A thioesterase THEM4 n=1 Tax=Streptosporangium lutulentum TaxID=1461250 RepID=A0ABT9QIJ5_9ACTN|nr:PaaI family thioesterase [Streptosporangium lutulentum]MDP9845899.1 acyl-coenzyme A thioesterase PaaI-like protein [Streptosporangium lutulentum]
MTIELASAGDTEDPAAAGDRPSALDLLTQQVRDLVDAVVLTGVPQDELVEITAELAALTDRLRALRRTSRHPLAFDPEGVPRHAGNAVTGSANPYALPLVSRVTSDGTIRAELSFRQIHEGPPTSVHGGVSAMVLDQVLGQAVAVAGGAGMTGTLTLRYVRRVPYGEPLVATAEYLRTEGRKSWAEGRIALPDGTPLVEATGLFITPRLWTEGTAGSQ